MVRLLSISVFVTFSAVFLYHESTVTAQEIASADSMPACNCVLLHQCLGLVHSDQRTLLDAIELRKRRCGTEGRKVCCPDSGTPTVVTIPNREPPVVLPILNSGPPVVVPSNPSWPSRLPSATECGQVSYQNKLHGGWKASLGAHPWMVALLYRDSSSFRNSDLSVKCGGSLITSQHVLTTATCVNPQFLGTNALEQLNVGDWNILTDPDCESDAFVTECGPNVPKRKPAKITWHPQYNSNRRYNNDIAVIRLDRPIDLPSYKGYINTVCVPTSFSQSDYTRPYATGWGQTEDADRSDILKEIRLPIVDLHRCNDSFRGMLSENQMCAGGEEGKDTCYGDSGGPLVSMSINGPPMQVIGLTSFGKSVCGGLDNYGVYTVVADFREWIEETLKL